MKYLTKEWHIQSELASIHCFTGFGSYVKHCNDDVFKLIYARELRRREAKLRMYYDTDAETAKLWVDTDFNFRLKIYMLLPQKILDKVTDIRLLALGYATKKVDRLLRRYGKKLRKTSGCEKLFRWVYEQNEKYCDYSILFDKLVGIEEQDGDITLEFEWGHKIFIKNARVTETERCEFGNGRRNFVCAAELYENEIHFLMHSDTGDCDSKLWYLTIGGEKIEYIEAKVSKFERLFPEFFNN